MSRKLGYHFRPPKKAVRFIAEMAGGVSYLHHGPAMHSTPSKPGTGAIPVVAYSGPWSSVMNNICPIRQLLLIGRETHRTLHPEGSSENDKRTEVHSDPAGGGNGMHLSQSRTFAGRAPQQAQP